MKKRKILLIIILSLILVTYLLINIFSPKLLQKEILYSEVIVSDYIGINVNNTDLIFGTIIPGGSSSKKLSIANEYNKKVKIKLYSKGDINKVISISENNFILLKNEKKEITFHINLPPQTEKTTYTGEVIIKIYKV